MYFTSEQENIKQISEKIYTLSRSKARSNEGLSRLIFFIRVKQSD
jgi:hypothetical protein